MSRRVTSEQVDDILHEGPHDWDMDTVLAICRDWLDMDAREAGLETVVMAAHGVAGYDGSSANVFHDLMSNLRDALARYDAGEGG